MPGTGAPTSRYAFAYDQAGERVLKYRVDGGVVKEVYFYVRDEAGNTLSELLWGTQSEEPESRSWTRDADWVYAGREPVVRLGRQNTTNYRTYTTLVTDHLGSTRAEVLSTSSPTKMDYWPYGDLFSQPPLITEKHMFTAQEREFIGSTPSTDPLGDLDQMHQREYGFRLGRFVSIDPVGGKVGSSQSWNRYAYVLGNPVALTDPQGETVDLSALSDEDRELLLRELKEYTGNTYGVNDKNELFMEKAGEGASETATNFLNDAMKPESGTFKVEATQGETRNDPMGSKNILLNFNQNEGLTGPKGLNLATFNTASAFIHEARHATTGLGDWDGKPENVSLRNWPGPIIDFDNKIRRERGFATRNAWGYESIHKLFGPDVHKHAFTTPEGKVVYIYAPAQY